MAVALVTLNMIPNVALGPLIIVWFKYGVFPNSMMAFSIRVFCPTPIRGRPMTSFSRMDSWDSK